MQCDDKCQKPEDICKRNLGCMSAIERRAMCRNFTFWLEQSCEYDCNYGFRGGECRRCTGNAPYSCYEEAHLNEMLKGSDDVNPSTDDENYYYISIGDEEVADPVFQLGDDDDLWTTLQTYKSCDDDSDLVFPATIHRFCDLQETFRFGMRFQNTSE